MTLASASPRTTPPAARRAPAPTSERLPAPPPAPGPGGGPAGRYRYDLRTDQWWWSPQVFALHGLTPGSVLPGVSLLLTGAHPQDRARVRQALADACTAGVPFALEHRVVRSDGEVRTAVLVGELETTPDGQVTALSGLVVDVTDGRAAAQPGDQVRALESEIEQLRTAMASRAAIEQAKGVLMLLMGCGDGVAFDLLAHISSHTHRKVRDVATAIVESASGGTPLPADVRGILHDACPPGASAV
ncbi:MAG: fold-containing protein [Modestobacter sp.]|nr:fold-containing protein [Modestobacter sp.]